MAKKKKQTFRPAKGEMAFLIREFIGQRVSAAGLPYIVNSKSTFRRFVWCLAVIIIFCLMGYMTIKVIMEYLKYPKMIQKKEVINTRLHFPAVTVCSLSPLASKDNTETSVYKLKKLNDLIKKAKMLRPKWKLQSQCLRHPMCQWSWLRENCSCAHSPCLTELCSRQSTKQCWCSTEFCASEYEGLNSLCRNVTLGPHPFCDCNSTSSYVPDEFVIENNARSHGKEDELSKVLAMIDDPEIKEVVKIIRNSGVDDLADVEDYLFPNLNDLYHHGVKFTSLIVACSFEGMKCLRENFTILYSPEYGRCYMFNFVGSQRRNVRRPLDVENHGISKGLQLLLHIDEKETVRLASRQSGARVVIHSPYEFPFIKEQGLNVRSNDMTSIHVSMSETHRLGRPWGNCMKDGSELAFPYRSTYILLGCEKACRSFYLIKYCKCSKREFLRGFVNIRITQYENICSVVDTNTTRCIDDVMMAFKNHSIICGCHPPCKEILYGTSMSSSALNTQFYNVLKAVNTLVLDGDTLSYTDWNDNKSKLGLKIRYTSFKISKEIEIASYSWETLIANIGGNLGFFMGLTLVTFLEITEFFGDVLYTLIRQLFQWHFKNRRFRAKILRSKKRRLSVRKQLGPHVSILTKSKTKMEKLGLF